jgi:hypothetical protein
MRSRSGLRKGGLRLNGWRFFSRKALRGYIFDLLGIMGSAFWDEFYVIFKV